MTHPAKVSVVVPVYNAEKHLAECLDSLLAQTHSNIELICVDDGSKDSSPEILQAYEQRDHRVSVIRQANAGPGVARNRGMDEAAGDFLYFFDSDDFCDANLIENALKCIEDADADLVSFPFKEYDDRTGVSIEPSWAATPLSKYGSSVIDWRESPDWTFQAFHNYPWNKLLRTKFARDNNVRFQEIHLTEDLMYSAVAVVRSRRACFTGESYVHHRVGTGENTMANKDAHPLDFLTAFLALKDFLIEEGVYSQLETSYVNWALGGCQYNLTTMKSYEGFKLVHETLARGGIERLGLLAAGKNAYFYQSYLDFLDALISLTSEELIWHLYRKARDARDASAFRLAASEQEAVSLRKETKRLADGELRAKRSLDYRLGHAALTAPRLVKNALKRKEG